MRRGVGQKVSTPLVPLATIPSPSLEASKSHLINKIKLQEALYESQKTPWLL